MSLRSRLAAFFLLIVVMPMVAVAVLLIRTSGELSSGRVQAQLGQAARTAQAVYGRELGRLEDASLELAAELEAKRAWRMRPARLAALLRREVESDRFLSATLLGAGDRPLRQVGSRGALHSVVIRFTRTSGPVRAVSLAGVPADGFAARVADLTGAEALLADGSRVIAASDPGLRPDGERDLDPREWELIDVELGSGYALTLAMDRPEVSPIESRPLLSALFVALLLAALAMGWLLWRAVHSQLNAMLDAAKQIGRGDFAARVPERGRDELALFAREFNRMAGLVEEQFGHIVSQEEQLRRSVRRLGEAMAQGLDRDGLPELALMMTIEACGADYGLLLPEGSGELALERIELAAESEGPHEQLDATAGELIARIRAAATHEPLAETAGEWHALAVALRHGRAAATMVLLRRESAFGEAEREIFSYLTGQIAVSLENLAMLNQLEREATTDELTGLANRRRFNRRLASEAARARRFAHPLSLVMLDIDDFKPINDRYGHSVGDEALRRLAQIMRSQSRSIDEPARLGGEEFVILLPETPLEGAREIAERLRRRIADDPRKPRFTVSAGVAELGRQMQPAELIEAADTALYAAKGRGKNCVVAHEHEGPAGPDKDDRAGEARA